MTNLIQRPANTVLVPGFDSAAGQDSPKPADWSRSDSEVPSHDLSWGEAEQVIEDIAGGWFFFEEGELLEHELDAQGNEEQPSPHGRFTLPAEAVSYVRQVLARRGPSYFAE